MAYRNIEVLPAVDLSAEKRPGRDERANNDETRHISPSLLQICARTVAAHLHRSNACEVLSFTEALLLPPAGGDELREAAAGVTAANFSEILSERPDRLCALSAESLKRVAKHSNMVRMPPIAPHPRISPLPWRAVTKCFPLLAHLHQF
jgi:hypothetical protein